MTTTTNFERHLEELHLLQCSLLAGEKITFVHPVSGAGGWQELLDSYSDGAFDSKSYPSASQALYPACLRVRSEGVPMWFDVELPSEYPKVAPIVLVRGDEITRSEQERWQSIVRDKFRGVKDSEYPLYDLISTHLLPLIYDANFVSTPEPPIQQASASAQSTEKYHALLTSHHLISPTKRRNLQSWSSQQSITGFAKVGYPGVIYCEGTKDQVEEFVGKVKEMQWLALRLRFVEPVPRKEDGDELVQSAKRTWSEFEKVGDVVSQMRRLGRENYIVEMGIGSSGKS